MTDTTRPDAGAEQNAVCETETHTRQHALERYVIQSMRSRKDLAEVMFDRIAQLEAELAAVRANALPELPEWVNHTSVQLHHFVDGLGSVKYAAGTGPTIGDAIADALRGERER